MEQERPAAAAIDGIARHRHAQPFGGMDANLVGAPRLGHEFDERARVLDLDHPPARARRLAVARARHPPAAFGAAHLDEREVDHAFLAFGHRSEEHTSELQSLMRTSYAVFCLKKKNNR